MEALASGLCFRLVFEKQFGGVHFPFRLFGGGIFQKMISFSVLVACLVVLPRGQAEARSVPRRYKPIIQVTEEIDINDITFTTSAPEFERSSSHKASNYYNGINPEAAGKSAYSRIADTSPSLFYGSAVPKDKIYATGQPLIVPVTKYKPYKVFKVQDGYRQITYKPKVVERTKLLAFEQPTAFGEPETLKKNSNLVPFSSPLPAKAPTTTSGFPAQESKNFIPSPTFSPTVLALVNSENNQKFPESSDIGSFAARKTVDWPKPTKKPSRIKTGKKITEVTTNKSAGLAAEEFIATSGKLQENLTPHNFQKEAPQQSESFLSEIATLHKDGSSPSNLDGVAEPLDLKTGERVEFQMYGMDGPQSYKFGFDTGKGHNRHFRFEERDNTGKVKGHYGYLDEDGKMRIMKYEADPITGFHAGPVEISPDDN